MDAINASIYHWFMPRRQQITLQLNSLSKHPIYHSREKIYVLCAMWMWMNASYAYNIQMKITKNENIQWEWDESNLNGAIKRKPYFK